MSDEPKPKPDSRVPSFGELQQRPQPAVTRELAMEEKTAQISPEVLRRALAQAAAPTAPPPPTRQVPAPPTQARPAPPPPLVPPPSKPASVPPGLKPIAAAAPTVQTVPVVATPVSAKPAGLAIPPPAPGAKAPPGLGIAPALRAPPPGSRPMASAARADPLTDPDVSPVQRAPAPKPPSQPPPPPGKPTVPEARSAASLGSREAPTAALKPALTDATAVTAPPAPAHRPVQTDPFGHPPHEAGEVTAPGLPQIRAQTAVSVGVPARAETPKPATAPRTDRVQPVTPDAMPRGTAGRGNSPVQVAAPAKHDPSLHQTQLSTNHQGARLPDPHSSPTLLESRPPGEPRPQPAVSAVTQPHAENPFLSPRSNEPPSGPRAPALPPEPPTRNERPGPRQSNRELEQVTAPTPAPRKASREIAGDVSNEVRKLPGALAPEPPTGKTDTVEVIAHPAPFGARVGAFVVDLLLLGAIDAAIAFGVMVLGKVPALPEGLGLLDRFAMRVHDSGKLVAAAGVMAIGLAAAYTTLFAVIWSGRTIGRRLMGIQLVDRRGAAPGALRALARAFMALLSFAFFGCGFWWALFDRKGQTLHDKVCSTFVVRLGPQRT